MTIQNTDIAPVQASHTKPYAFSKNFSTDEILPVTRHALPKGSARIAVVWCPQPKCDSSQQVTLDIICRNCRSSYYYEDPTPVEELEDTIITTLVGAEETTDMATYCQPCGRQLATPNGLGLHERSQGHADRLKLLAQSGE